MKALLLIGVLAFTGPGFGSAATLAKTGIASWYGEAQRGKLMANGQKFDPDKLTAASWFYPLGTKVNVTLTAPHHQPRTVAVTITDRGPARRLVRQNRIIDLTFAAFKELADPERGLVAVKVERQG